MALGHTRQTHLPRSESRSIIPANLEPVSWSGPVLRQGFSGPKPDLRNTDLGVRPTRFGPAANHRRRGWVPSGTISVQKGADSS